MFFKVVHNKQVHVYNSKGQPTFDALNKYILEVFKQLPSKYYLTYFDEEDEITLACESDFETMKQISQKTVKIFIKEVDESYYDQTQKVVLDDERIEPLQEKMEELRLSQSDEHVELRDSQPDMPVVNPVVEQKEVLKPVEIENVSIQKESDQPQIIQEKSQSKIQQNNPILDQSEIESSKISQITEAQIEEKFREMMPEFMEKVKNSLLKKSESQSSQKSKIIHAHITCDECGKTNIQGVRYKCSVCADFDLCQKCEATSSHDHPFLKIKHPGQTPYKIIAIVRDEEQNSFEVNGQRVQLPQFSFANQLFQAFCPRPQQFHGGRFGHHGGRFGQHGGRFGQHGGRFGQHGKGRHGCPFKNKFEKKCDMNEQKCEEKSEPQKKTKTEQEKPVEKKFEAKTEQKQSINVEPKVSIPIKRQVMQVQKDQTEITMENANYLFSCLNGCADINEAQSYDFAMKHQGLSKEELLQVYLSEKF